MNKTDPRRLHHRLSVLLGIQEALQANQYWFRSDKYEEFSSECENLYEQIEKCIALLTGENQKFVTNQDVIRVKAKLPLTSDDGYFNNVFLTLNGQSGEKKYIRTSVASLLEYYILSKYNTEEIDIEYKQKSFETPTNPEKTTIEKIKHWFNPL